MESQKNRSTAPVAISAVDSRSPVNVVNSPITTADPRIQGKRCLPPPCACVHNGE